MQALWGGGTGLAGLGEDEAEQVRQGARQGRHEEGKSRTGEDVMKTDEKEEWEERGGAFTLNISHSEGLQKSCPLGCKVMG